MQYVERNGVQAPAIGLGTYPMVGAQCRRAVLWALEAGYRHIDTAQLYENEADVGAALAESGVPRGDVFLTTKCGTFDASPGAVLAELDDSLAKLRTDHVDLWMLHWPSRGVPVGETLDAMATACDDGRVRALGVGNFTVPLMREAMARHAGLLFTNQFENHPMLRQPHVETTAHELGLTVTAHSPLGRGKVPGNRVLDDIGAKYGKSAVQVAIRWQLDKPDTMLVPKSTRREGICHNLEVFDFTLDDEDRAAIETLPNGRRGSDPSFAPDWDPIEEE